MSEKVDIEKFQSLWVATLDESLEDGINRARRVMKSFGIMMRFEEGPGVAAFSGADCSSKTTINEGDFLRIALLACIGISEFEEPPALVRSVLRQIETEEIKEVSPK